MFMIRSLDTGNWFTLLDNTFTNYVVEWSPNVGYVFDDLDEAKGIVILLEEPVEILQVTPR